ncbi:MAG: M48 family metallopeptidase [bacterium]
MSSASRQSKTTAKFWTLALLLLAATAMAAPVSLKRGGVLLREGPGNFYPVLAVLQSGVAVNPSGEPEMGWQKVKSPAGEGWVSTNIFNAEAEGTVTPIAEISKRSELSGAVKNAAVSAMIKGMKAGPEGDALATMALYPQVDPNTTKTFRKGFDVEDEPAPFSASNVGLSLLPEIMAASPLIADNIAREWGGRDKRFEGYLNQVNLWLAERAGADAIAPVVIVSRQGANAQALPGGWVVVGGELLAMARDESEMAGLLAHEMSHAVLHHAERSLQKEGWRSGAESVFEELEQETSGSTDTSDLEAWAKQVQASARRRYNRNQEFQADSLAVVITARAGYDPSGVLRVIKRLYEQEGGRLTGRGQLSLSWYGSRQELEQRISRLEEQLKHYSRKIKKGKRNVERFNMEMRG